MLCRSDSFRFLLLIAITFLSSSSLRGDDRAALIDRLHTAAVDSALDSAGVKPWHLVLSFQHVDAQGRPGETGTIEVWWESPKLHKIVYQSPSYSNTEITNDQGVYKQFPNLYPPEALALVRDQILHPLPEQIEIDDSKPELRKEVFSKVPLDCIMLDQKLANTALPPLGLFPTYCFDQGKNSLRMSLTSGSVLVVRNAMGQFQSKSVAVSQSVSIDNVPVIKAHVEKLTGATFAASDFAPTSEMTLTDDHLTQVPGKVMAGSILRKVAPIYPESAKARHVSGTVVLRAIVGTDGRIHHLTLVSSPGPDLAMAAFAAVRSWTYSTYLLNGKPTSVDTTVTINFSFGP